MDDGAAAEPATREGGPWRSPAASSPCNVTRSMSADSMAVREGDAITFSSRPSSVRPHAAGPSSRSPVTLGGSSAHHSPWGTAPGMKHASSGRGPGMAFHRHRSVAAAQQQAISAASYRRSQDRDARRGSLRVHLGTWLDRDGVRSRTWLSLVFGIDPSSNLGKRSFMIHPDSQFSVMCSTISIIMLFYVVLLVQVCMLTCHSARMS